MVMRHTLCVSIIALLFFILGSARAQEPVQYAIQKPGKVKRGEQFEIAVKFSILPGWYIYAPTGLNEAQGMIETNVVFDLPDGITRKGKIQMPEPHFLKGHEVYAGDSVAMTQPLKVSNALNPGRYIIKGKITWQTCSEEACLMPAREEVAILIEVK